MGFLGIEGIINVWDVVGRGSRCFRRLLGAFGRQFLEIKVNLRTLEVDGGHQRMEGMLFFGLRMELFEKLSGVFDVL